MLCGHVGGLGFSPAMVYVAAEACRSRLDFHAWLTADSLETPGHPFPNPATGCNGLDLHRLPAHSSADVRNPR
jgi:hypothetical protein